MVYTLFNVVLYVLMILLLFNGVYGSGSLNIVNENRFAWKSVWTSVSGQYSYAVATNGYIYYSSDYSETWSISNENQQNWNHITSDEGMNLVIASIYGGDFYYVENSNYWYEFSSFGYKDWYGHCINVNLLNGDITLYAVERTNGYIYSSSAYISDYVVYSNSQKWNGIACAYTPVDIQYYYIHAIAYNGFIYSSYDNAVTWNASFSESLPWSAIAVSIDSQYVYATTYGQYIYSSNNYGNIGSWQLSYSHNTLWTSITARIGTEAYAVDLLGGIYALESGSWSKVYNSYKKLTSVSASNDSSYILTSGFQDYLYLFIPSTAPTHSPTLTSSPTLSPTPSPTEAAIASLVVKIDFTDPDCYTSGNAYYTNLIDSSRYALYGTTYQNTDGSLRLDNTQSGSDLPASGIYVGFYNIFTISMWIKIESIDNTQSKYLFDLRPYVGSYCYIGGASGVISYSINGASYYSSANTFCIDINYLPIGSWIYLTLNLGGYTSNIYLFSRYVETEGVDCSVKSIYVYSDYVTEETNYQNYLDTKSYFANAPTLSPTTLSSYQYSDIIGFSDIGVDGYSGNAKCNSGIFISNFHVVNNPNIALEAIGFYCTDGGGLTNSLYEPAPYSEFNYYSACSSGISSVTVYYTGYINGFQTSSACGTENYASLSGSFATTFYCNEGYYLVGMNWYTNLYIIGIQFVCGQNT